ncbi:MAG: portal protein [Alphaproteobacteria bacterium]|nr:portal protein [Alphaproteobacteria bacterium]
MQHQKNYIEEEQTQQLTQLIERYKTARDRRQNWESHWQECYDYALPQRGGFTRFNSIGTSRVKNLFDGTAMDAVDQLAASLLGNLTPPWSQWFGLKPGPQLSQSEAADLAPVLEDISRKIQIHFEHSNFSVEMHQCFLDLAVGGTSTLYFEENEPGAFSAFKFSAVPLNEIVLEEGDNGFLDGSYRQLSMTLAQMQGRYSLADMPDHITREGEKDPQARFDVLETILPENGIYQFKAILMDQSFPVLLQEGQFHQSPAISFRWMKSPGESYGRSPVMKALPDIKTANKVVELILKNASIAVTGIWQADDDGVLNPANIELTPGSIIPKAVGSQGLKALDMPGRFDVSELVLNDLRARIRHALLVDKLGPVQNKRMSATEVLERSSEMAMLLGATYGRLQSELLTPLIKRAFSILRRRGEIPDIALDGRYVSLDYRSPLARAQGQKNIQNILMWLDSLSSMGAGASASVETQKTAQYLGEALGVPADLIQVPDLSETILQGGEDVLEEK